jgi:hypothetical protein
MGATRTGHTWSRAQHVKYSATAARKRALRETLNGKAPEVLYVMHKGALKRFVLRTMSVYVPAESD